MMQGRQGGPSGSPFVIVSNTGHRLPLVPQRFLHLCRDATRSTFPQHVRKWDEYEDLVAYGIVRREEI